MKTTKSILGTISGNMAKLSTIILKHRILVGFRLCSKFSLLEKDSDCLGYPAVKTIILMSFKNITRLHSNDSLCLLRKLPRGHRPSYHLQNLIDTVFEDLNSIAKQLKLGLLCQNYQPLIDKLVNSMPVRPVMTTNSVNNFCLISLYLTNAPSTCATCRNSSQITWQDQSPIIGILPIIIFTILHKQFKELWKSCRIITRIWWKHTMRNEPVQGFHQSIHNIGIHYLLLQNNLNSSNLKVWAVPNF